MDSRRLILVFCLGAPVQKRGCHAKQGHYSSQVDDCICPRVYAKGFHREHPGQEHRTAKEDDDSGRVG